MDQRYSPLFITKSQKFFKAIVKLGITGVIPCSPIEAQGGTMFLLHDGRANSIDEAILAHLEGEAKAIAEAYFLLSDAEREQLKKFLMSL